MVRCKKKRSRSTLTALSFCLSELKETDETKPLASFYITKADILQTIYANLGTHKLNIPLSEEQFEEIAERTLDAITEDLTDQIKYTFEAMNIDLWQFLPKHQQLIRELDDKDEQPDFEVER